MEEETASWSSEDSKTPLWKLDVDPSDYLLSGGRAR